MRPGFRGLRVRLQGPVALGSVASSAAPAAMVIRPDSLLAKAWGWESASPSDSAMPVGPVCYGHPRFRRCLPVPTVVLRSPWRQKTKKPPAKRILPVPVADVRLSLAPSFLLERSRQGPSLSSRPGFSCRSLPLPGISVQGCRVYVQHDR